MFVSSKISNDRVLTDGFSDEFAYSFYCTLFRLICLTAKALRRMAMRSFLVGATKPEKRTLNRVQLRISGL